MSRMAVQYIEVIQSQLMEDLRGRVKIDELAVELNKAVTKYLVKEAGASLAELANMLEYYHDLEKLDKAEAKVKRTMGNLLFALNRDMESRIVEVSVQLKSGEEQLSGAVESEDDTGH